MKKGNRMKFTMELLINIKGFVGSHAKICLDFRKVKHGWMSIGTTESERNKS